MTHALDSAHRIEKIIQSDPLTFQNMAHTELLNSIYASEAAKVTGCPERKQASETAQKRAYAIYNAVCHVLAGTTTTATDIETLQAWLNPCRSLAPIAESD